ncbi:TatD family deoxyribonuclease [Formicincola oecophyllae]|uniref:TatD family deoxyribonuclease n=1 Tax=Formicincola oecophyllae TaxID=2558361 RepID=A0A4Y6U6F2_9PROT|nr:TatD family hydrolase [Formicincola oecophyllae]QDH12929.1 TatD family deoxyribonuclease [Formicincola oecophyllae]
MSGSHAQAGGAFTPPVIATTLPGLVDTHCHLDMVGRGHGGRKAEPAPADENARTEAILQQGREAGLAGMVTIGTRWSRRHQQHEWVARSHPSLPIHAALGIHPDHVLEEELPTLDEMLVELDRPGIVAIGETGLDYFHNSDPTTHERQKTYLRRHIEASRRTGLPVVIHSRNADADTVALLREETAKGAFPFLIHCFAGGVELAQGALALGGYLSFSGLVTFPKCATIRDVAATAPLERILVETDSPYLAPVPHRGHGNWPGHVVHTATEVAKLRHMAPKDLASATTANARRLFSRMA